MTPWRRPMAKTNPERKRWHSSMERCGLCNSPGMVKSKSNYCPQHRRWLDEVERGENRAIVEAAALPAMPKPPPLPPRGTLR